MEIFKGKSVYGGIAVGRLSVISDEGFTIKRMRVADTEKELARYNKAKETASAQLEELYEKAVKEVGESNAAIFEIHRMMLEDEDYNDSVANIINTQSVNAEYAVSVTGDNFSNMFSSMEDEYMKARAADVRDISERLIRALCGAEEALSDSGEPRIFLADDLAPSQTVQLDKDKVLSFVTVHGSSNSHTAILAKTMNIPSIIGCGIEPSGSLNGRMAAVDGYAGVLYLDPDKETLSRLKQRQQEDKEKQELLYSLKGKENVTLDGRKVKLYANIGNIKDLAAVFMNDAEGIGLFRSEFIYLERSDFPGEEEQFLIYKKAAETMAGKKVIIRTLDIGADKQAGYFELSREANPAMGCRAIRICLKRPDIFKTQLRALFRAAVFGNISIMYPMITSTQELSAIRKVVAEVKAELTAQELEFAIPEQGIMIETPAAVMISDLLAKEADFFSIGTNDLTQYTLAADRQNESIEDFYDPHHPAVLRMIQMVIDNAHKNGIWAGICGELAADTSLTEEFLRMGIDELSVTPSAVLRVRKAIRDTSLT